jgi:SagB-type dehydrogenase family enzyme
MPAVRLQLVHDAVIDNGEQRWRHGTGDAVPLPPPDELGGPPIALTLGRRRSIREFSSGQLSAHEMSQLLWAAQGVTDAARGLRTAPSAGALYPLEVDVVTEQGLFRYRPRNHALLLRDTRDLRPSLSRAALSQPCIAHAACVFAMLMVTARTTAKYGARGLRYAVLEAGHAAQNILLQACALGLGAVPVGAFADAAVAHALDCGASEEPVYLIAVGAIAA